MHLSGQYSNPSAPLKAVLGLLDGDAAGPQDAAEETAAYPAPASGRPTPPQLRWGAIQAAILIVLGEAKKPMRVREVHARVEGHLGLKVSYHTVCSFLIAAGKSPRSGVLKAGYGTYRAAP
jgi:hypothetical protein